MSGLLGSSNSGAVSAGGHAQVFGAVTAEIAERSEIHDIRNLRERVARIIQVFFQDWDGDFIVVENTGGKSCIGFPLCEYINKMVHCPGSARCNNRYFQRF